MLILKSARTVLNVARNLKQFEEEMSVVQYKVISKTTDLLGSILVQPLLNKSNGLNKNSTLTMHKSFNSFAIYTH